MGASKKPQVFPLSVLSIAALLAYSNARAATQPVDLDALPSNSAESMCSTDVLSPSPVQVENRVTNRTNGDAFTFLWPSAGPGGFTSSVTAGTQTGVGAIWQWTTNQSVVGFTGNSCPTDVCFAQTSGPDSASGFCSDACPNDSTSLSVRKGAVAGTVDLIWTGGTATFTVYRGTTKIAVVAPANSVGTTNTFTFTDTPPANTSVFYVVRGTDCSRKACASNNDCNGPSDGICLSRGPFGVPGRALASDTGVTVSAQSLATSLITFFSPLKPVFRAVASTNAGGIAETLTNFSLNPVTVTIPAFPPGCCPFDSDHPHQIRCGSECIDYLSDPNNCGGCGNICGDGTCCSNGNCVSVCDEGQTFCDGECVFLQSDNGNCGTCGFDCGESGCCSGGTCHDLCGGGLTLCGDSCVDLTSDFNNCGACSHGCSDGTCCSDSVCASLCDVGWTWCDGVCANLASDSANCAECGSSCDPGYCCNGSACVSKCPEGRVWCNGECVNLDFDPGNCGTCGNTCPKGCCDSGVCHASECGDQIYPIEESCPNLTPTYPQDGNCPGDYVVAPSSCPDVTSPSLPSGVCFGEEPAPELQEAPVCTVNESTTPPIPPGGSTTTCRPGGPLFIEVPSVITVCGDGIPGVDGECNGATTHITTGTFNRFMPHPTAVPGNAFVTPFTVHVVSDESGDGMLEPGESGGLLIDLLNAGSMNITGATATAAAPASDLTGDGVSNPVGLTIDTAAHAYGTIPAMAPGTNCLAPKPLPATNATPFQVTVPLNHPGDTGHRLVVTVTGTVNGGAFSMDVPLTLGIADKCDPASGSGDFDGVDGLLTPMGKLVPEGDPLPVPKSFNAGTTRPLKLRVGCGGVNVTETMITPPQIVGISEAIRGPIDITFLNVNADGTPASTDFFFVENDLLSGPHWQYNLSTDALGTGTFTLTIKIGGKKNYVTGFVLE